MSFCGRTQGLFVAWSVTILWDAAAAAAAITAAAHLLFVLLPDSRSFPPAAEGRPEVTVAQRAHSCGQPGLEQLVVLGVLLPGLKS